MLTRETRSAPVIWVPHAVRPGHGHTHGGRRDDYGPSRSRAIEPAPRNGQTADGLKVFVVDYKKGPSALCCATMFTCVQLAIGALNMGALIYSLSVGDLHTILCCTAYHLFSAEAILAMSYKNGWSLLMGYDNRTMCHVILQILSLIFAIVGVTIKIVVTGVTGSAHSITGILTGALAIPTIIFGPMGLFKKSKTLKIIHMLLGLSTFLSASICFGIAVFMERFTEWAKQNSSIINIITILLLVYICLVMIILVISKLADIDIMRAERRRK